MFFFLSEHFHGREVRQSAAEETCLTLDILDALEVMGCQIPELDELSHYGCIHGRCVSMKKARNCSPHRGCSSRAGHGSSSAHGCDSSYEATPSSAIDVMSLCSFDTSPVLDDSEKPESEKSFSRAQVPAQIVKRRKTRKENE